MMWPFTLVLLALVGFSQAAAVAERGKPFPAILGVDDKIPGADLASLEVRQDPDGGLQCSGTVPRSCVGPSVTGCTPSA